MKAQVAAVHPGFRGDAIPAMRLEHRLAGEGNGMKTSATNTTRTGEGRTRAKHNVEFVTVNIRNRNTRAAYARAGAVFLAGVKCRAINALGHVEPVHVATYIEQLQS